jgi:hypothetical protein
MIPDFLMYCNKNNARLLLGIIKVIGWGIRESIKYNNYTFLVKCFKLGIYTAVRINKS